jgi:squalene cyclase
VPAEMWLLPLWTPFHPARMWCHSRMVYLPMCYLYCKRWVYPAAETDPLIAALRSELFCEPYSTINWDAHRHSCWAADAYAPPRPVMRAVQNALALYERWGCRGPLRWLRNRGLRFAAEYMAAEDAQTNFIDIGPVNKAFHILVSFVEGGDSPGSAYQKHLQRIGDYLWVAEDGMKMQVNAYTIHVCMSICSPISIHV